MLTFAFISVVLGGLIAMIAQSKGAQPGRWLIYGVLLWPVALPHVLLKKSVSGENPPRAVAGPLGAPRP